jgi:hypothetical protein
MASARPWLDPEWWVAIEIPAEPISRDHRVVEPF